jgi:hypothetical protein
MKSENMDRIPKDIKTTIEILYALGIPPDTIFYLLNMNEYRIVRRIVRDICREEREKYNFPRI